MNEIKNQELEIQEETSRQKFELEKLRLKAEKEKAIADAKKWEAMLQRGNNVK